MRFLATASVVYWSEFLAADPEVFGSIPGYTRFSEYQLVRNGVHSALMRINVELLERKAAAPVYKTEINGRGSSAALTTRRPSLHKIWY
jgi:hypothetical protein